VPPPPTNSRSSSAVTTIAIVLAAVAVAVLARSFWSDDDAPAPPRPAPAAHEEPAPVPEAAPPTTAQGSGIFGAPLAKARKPTPPPDDAEENEDMPSAADAATPRRRPHARRRTRGGGEARAHDPHAVFQADVTTAYASGTQTTIDDVKGLSGDAGTIVLWMQPTWLGTSQDDASLVTFGDGTVRLLKNVTFLRFEVVDENGALTGVGAPISAWNAGEWHQVVATWDGRVVWLYVDGGVVATAAQSGRIVLPEGTPVHIGSAFPLGRPVAPAMLAGVTIRDRALTPLAVARRFLAGPPVPPTS